MWDILGGAVLIACMRICDVSLDTIRVINVVQGKKYAAGLIGFFEVLIWIFAIRFIFQHLDNFANFIGYASGYGLGNILGITIEQKIGLGFIQMNIISLHSADKIADHLRKSRFGVTILPAEGGSGGLSVIVVLIPRKRQRETMALIKSIDAKAFIAIQPSIPHGGFMQGLRK